jgi:hypothetical protein
VIDGRVRWHVFPQGAQAFEQLAANGPWLVSGGG